MKLILLSANGHGAGKTTLAGILGGMRMSLANQIRKELSEEYPDTDWFSQDQTYKNNHIVTDGLTVRDMLIQRGQEKRNEDPEHWCKALASKLPKDAGKLQMTIIIDDIRFVNELKFFKDWADKTGVELHHFHLKNPAAKPEPQYDSYLLELRAEYTVHLDTRPIGIESFGGDTNWRQAKGINHGF